MYIVLLGAPGAGKGTQAAVMARQLKLAHMATGDMFRQEAARGTELGLKLKEYMEQGKLVPDDITIRMLLGRMSSAEAPAGVILDGFPRNLEQAEALDRALEEQGKAIDSVVYIRVDEDELLKRLSGRWICRSCQAPYHMVSSPPRVGGKCDKCGGELYQRPDDRAETVKERLKVYFAQTAPLIDYYTRAGKLLTVDGNGGVDEVSGKIMAALGKA
jgi:adenylate kinase